MAEDDEISETLKELSEDKDQVFKEKIEKEKLTVTEASKTSIDFEKKMKAAEKALKDAKKSVESAKSTVYKVSLGVKPEEPKESKQKKGVKEKTVPEYEGEIDFSEENLHRLEKKLEGLKTQKIELTEKYNSNMEKIDTKLSNCGL